MQSIYFQMLVVYSWDGFSGGWSWHEVGAGTSNRAGVDNGVSEEPQSFVSVTHLVILV
jgi:hypothetical protein